MRKKALSPASTMLRSPRSTSRRIRILPSVVYRLPFILWVLSWPQTNTSPGSKKAKSRRQSVRATARELGLPVASVHKLATAAQGR